MNNDHNQQAEGPALPNCAQFIKQLPFWTRVVYFGMLSSWLVDLFSGIPSLIVAGRPDTTFAVGWVWTLLTSCLYVQSLFMLMVIGYNFHTFLPKLQRRCSTPVLMLQFILHNALITAVSVGIGMLLGYDEQAVPVYGVKGIWFNMLTKYCLFNTHGTIKFCCFPFKITKKIYPLVLLLVLAVLQWSISIQMVVGLLWALLQAKVPVIGGLCAARSLIQKLGKLMPCAGTECWVSIQTQKLQDLRAKNMYENLQNYQIGKLAGSDDKLNKSAVEDPFSGKKGVRLSDY